MSVESPAVDPRKIRLLLPTVRPPGAELAAEDNGALRAEGPEEDLRVLKVASSIEVRAVGAWDLVVRGVTWRKKSHTGRSLFEY